MLERSAAKVQTVWSGVDWISATLGREEKDDQLWVHHALEALMDVQAEGNAYKRRSLMGFDGWETGGCFVGSNEKSHYAQFAGHYANEAYPRLEHPKVHVSRIDLQVTIQYDIELKKEGRYQYAKAIHHNKALSEHRRRKIHLFAGSDGGDTLYLGSPSSEQRGRIYNKDKQSGDKAYERAWRYEVVYRNALGDRMYRYITAAPDADNTVIIPSVVDWYRTRGVDILGLGNWAGNALPLPKRESTDVERKLRWIRNQVVPTIRKLAELGYAEELMEAIAEAISAARTQT